MFHVMLASDYLYAKCLFNWLSLIRALLVPYFLLSFNSHEMG